MLPFVPVGTPQAAAVRGPFAALTIDAERRRVFAAGARVVAMFDADTGKLLATIRIGGVRSIALEPLGGHLFAGTGDGRISEIDPDRKTIVHTLDAGGPVDVMLYDASAGRLYADGGARAALGVYDVRAFTPGTPFGFSGHVPGDVARDPVTGELYLAYTDRPEVAIVNARTGAVRASFAVTGLTGKRILRFDAGLGQIVVAGSNGLLDVYDRAGTRVGRISVPAGIGGCDLDIGTHVAACTYPAGIAFVQLVRDAPPQLGGTTALAPPELAGLDAKTHDAVVVNSNPDGSGAGVLHLQEPVPAPSPGPASSAR